MPQVLDVILARRKQLQSHAAASKLAAKAKKAAKLDRIAHPEKYKQLSPTVRRTGRVRIVNEQTKPSQSMSILTPNTFDTQSMYAIFTGSEGGTGGSGRYVPSEATQARRVVKRGG